MGFKEVMAFRQNGEIDKALEMALEDFKNHVDQWSAAALFWVLRDKAGLYTDSGEVDQAETCVAKMKEVIPHMGPTAAMAEETLQKLEKEIIPHYTDLRDMTEQLATERNKYKRRELVNGAYEHILEWQKKGGLDPRLKGLVADIVIKYIEQKQNSIRPEEYTAALDLYNELDCERPSQLHTRALQLAMDGKQYYGRRLSLLSFVQKWDVPTSLTDEDWQRTDRKQNKSLAEELLNALVLEDLDLHRTEVAKEVYYLLDEVERRGVESPNHELTRARVLNVEGSHSEAIELYEHALINVTQEARSWYEYAELTEDKVLKRSAYAKALKTEADEYQDYMLDLRLPFAELLMEDGLYEQALRELNIYAQLSGEKGRAQDPLYTKLMKQIPSGTEPTESNKPFYYDASRPIDEYIFRDLETTHMLVTDVMAIKVKHPQKMILPMIKLKSVDGRYALVNTRENGILPGDNRGRMYDVKLVEQPGQPLRAALLTPSEEDPKALFPTEYGYINGYHTELRAFHVITASSRHHYLPGAPEDYSVGDFVNYILFLEKTSTGTREFLVLPEKADSNNALATFPIVRAVVAQVYDDFVYIVTDDGLQGSFPISMAPYELSAGELCALRGFIFKKKDRETGDQQQHFVTLSMEPLPPELLQNP